MQNNEIGTGKELELQGEALLTERAGFFESDERFHELYPLPIAALARRHWTPIEVARSAAAFLSTHKDVRILDIGCGVGKFCLSAAYFAADARFYGVEQRASLLHQAEEAKKVLQLGNVHFIHANFTQLDFSNYDHFYFFNAFYENLDGTEKIDDSIAYSNELFDYYNRYLYRLLDQKPAGTRMVTYHSMEDEMPADYYVVDELSNNLLKFWIKA
ncbi:class I SAM-dependent methyltransferase [Niabella sp. 3A5MI-3]|nr:class I SAM-dependent methyltransferase [Niabella beijingensis]